MFNDDQTKTVTAIDRNSPLPLYYQLKRILLRHIQDGDIIPGETIPSETELQENYGVSRITVRRALGDLASEGYISRQPGRGTFVLQPKLQDRSERLGGFSESLSAQGFKVEWQVLQHDLLPVPSSVAQALCIDEGQPVLYFQRLVYADGEPIMLATVYVNVGKGITLTREELDSDSIYPLLERKYGIVVCRANRTIEATVALENEAQLLHVKPNTPMLLVKLVAYDQQGQQVAFVKALYRGDRYKYYHTITR
jgi:GntR family transcriptional regulator